METKVLATDKKSLASAGEIIRNGGLVAFPTETVYGLGASAFMPDAVKAIYEAKGRPQDNPLIVHISDIAEIDLLARDITDDAKALIHAFMPGPFTVILKKSKLVPDAVTAGRSTVAIRLPENATARAFIKEAGVPVAAPSANISGKPSPTKASHVKDDLFGRIDAIIDGEDCTVGVESTIVDATGKVPVHLRPGGITLEELKSVVSDIIVDERILSSRKDGEAPLCPGMKYTHYAPLAEVTVVEGDMSAVKKKINELLAVNEGKICGVLTMSENAYDSAIILSGGESNKDYARSLFSNLREFDRLGVEVVFAEFQSRDGYGLAIKNRLYKAASHRVIYV